MAWSIVLSHTHRFPLFSRANKTNVMSYEWPIHVYCVHTTHSWDFFTRVQPTVELYDFGQFFLFQQDFVILAPLLLFSFHRVWMTRILTSSLERELINVIDFAVELNLINCLKKLCATLWFTRENCKIKESAREKKIWQNKSNDIWRNKTKRNDEEKWTINDINTTRWHIIKSKHTHTHKSMCVRYSFSIDFVIMIFLAVPGPEET